MAAALLMSALALPPVAHRRVQLFYVSHVTGALAAGLLPLAHGFGRRLWNGIAPAEVPGIGFWIPDLLIRLFAMNGAPRRAVRMCAGRSRRLQSGAECRWLLPAQRALRQSTVVAHCMRRVTQLVYDAALRLPRALGGAAASLRARHTPTCKLTCTPGAGAGLVASKCVALRVIEAPASQPAHSTVRLAAPAARGRRYSAGQWVFLCIPRLGLTEWHPFTISSSGDDPDLTLHFAGHSKWTERVVQHARALDGAPAKVCAPTCACCGVLPSCVREQPRGAACAGCMSSTL